MEQEKQNVLVWEEPELKPLAWASAEGRACISGSNAVTGVARCGTGGVASRGCQTGLTPGNAF